MKTVKVIQIILFVLTISLCILTGCVSHQAIDHLGTAGIEFNPPPDFEPISKALEKDVICFYGNKNRDNINVSYFRYLEGRELTKTVCDELVEAFNSSELRTAYNASAAMSMKYTDIDGVKSCYYYYEVPRPTGLSRIEYKVYQGTCSKSYAVTAVYDSATQQQGLIQEALHSLKIKPCISQREGSLPAPAADTASFVLVDKSDRAYTVFMAIPEANQQEVRSKITGEKDVFLVEWSEFSQKRDEYLSSNILKNEYPDSRVVDGIYQLLERAPGVPFGLTWNGGVAITNNDYQYAKKMFEIYMASPEEYERTRVRDPQADPVKPEWHFGPLLGW